MNNVLNMSLMVRKRICSLIPQEIKKECTIPTSGIANGNNRFIELDGFCPFLLHTGFS
jgi:hypothetical protein